MTPPRHPVGERRAAYFHAFFAWIGVLHVLAGAGMVWFHGIGAVRHFRERERA